MTWELGIPQKKKKRAIFFFSFSPLSSPLSILRTNPCSVPTHAEEQNQQGTYRDPPEQSVGGGLFQNLRNNQKILNTPLDDFSKPTMDLLQTSIIQPPLRNGDVLFRMYHGSPMLIKDCHTFKGGRNEDPPLHLWKFK